MGKKPWVIGGILSCCGLTFILIGAVIPIFVKSAMKEGIIAGTVLTDEGEWKLWGQIPGDTKDIIIHEYHFYNVENPDEVLYQGAVPIITDMNGYTYQEFDDFIMREHTDYKGTDKAWIHYFLYMRVDNSPHCVWRNNTHPSDKVMQLSLGSLGAWYTMKQTPPESLALAAIFQLVEGLNTALALGAYTQGIASLFPSYNGAQNYIYKPAGISPEVGKLIWSDKYFGMGNWVTMQTWVMALQENMVDGNFVFPEVVSGSLYVLWQNFGLSPSQFTSIFSGQWKRVYDIVVIAFYNTYLCETIVENGYVCDPAYLGALQWTQSMITMEPPLGAPSQGPSIVSSNSSTFGFPEISYFMNYTGVYDRYPDVTFTIDDYFQLFYYDRVTGWPKWSNHTLLDVGHMALFFAEGRAGNFEQMRKDFNLTTVDHARVLWDYINEIVTLTALQGRTDQAIYNAENRGIASEASLGTVGSQAVYQLWTSLAELIPLNVTCAYDYIRLTFELGITCEDIIGDVLPGQQNICSIPMIQWGNYTATMALWILPYWNGITSEYGMLFQTVTGLSDEDMELLYSPQSMLVTNLTALDLELKDHYGCVNPGFRCFGWDLAAKQWGRGFVTENLPSCFKILELYNTSSIYYLFKDVQEVLVTYPEYYAYVLKFNLTTEGLTDAQIDNALTFDALLGASTLQNFFIMDFEQNYTGMKEVYMMDNPLDLLNWVRYCIDKFAFGGMFRAKTVETILWTDYDPFLAQIKTTNPLLGGQPNINPAQIQLGQNVTREQFEYVPLQFRHALNTGAKDIDEVRWYRLYNGAPYINILQEAYFGESPWGSVIEWVNFNPWAEYVQVRGGDTWNFQPFLTSDSDIIFFLDQASLVFNGRYIDETEYRGFTCLRFALDNSALENATQNPAQAVFYQFAPSGLVNQTSVMGAPLFGSKPYFLDCDPMLSNLVVYTRPELNVPSEYESYLNLEPNTGACFYITEQLQYNAELKPDALYPNLGKQSLNKYGYKTYMPMFFMLKTEEYDQHIVDKYWGDIKMALLIMQLCEIIGYTTGSILLVALGLYVLKLKINARRRAKGWTPDDGEMNGKLIESNGKVEDKAPWMAEKNGRLIEE